MNHDNFDKTCDEFGKIIGGKPEIKNGVCTVELVRNIPTSILGVRSQSRLLYPADFSFESLDSNGDALNLGAIALLQAEVTPFLSALRKNDNILIGTLSNHWLYEEPRILYTHFEALENPLEFAETVSKAFETLQEQNFT
ncbi:DUF1259 domain-containing protein [Jeotgalibacillus marinus]|uniref:DUF1259 domain-containing protein n=1 Tax=Jeotgalibacillus marinus TaxID=86667 RepID=A0ABV3Q6P4_9BACL